MSDLIKLDETTELLKISNEKYRYVNPTFSKPSAKLSDYNADIKLKVGKSAIVCVARIIITYTLHATLDLNVLIMLFICKQCDRDLGLWPITTKVAPLSEYTNNVCSSNSLAVC